MKNRSPADEENPAGFNARFNRGLYWLMSRLRVQDVPHLKRIITTVVGGTVLLLGVALVFLPGQVVVILAGLAILGTEYAWARHLLRKGRQLASRALSQTQRLVHRGEGPAAASVAEAAEASRAEAEAPAPVVVASSGEMHT